MPPLSDMPPLSYETTAPWERQLGEGARAHAAFLQYLHLGPARSLDRAGALVYPGADGAPTGRKRGATGRIREWAKRFNWASRAAAWDEQQHTQAMDAARKILAKRIERDLLKRYALADRALEKAREILDRSTYAQVRETVEIRDGAPTLIHQHFEPGKWTLRDAAALLKVADELKQSVAKDLVAQGAKAQARAEAEEELPDDVAERLERFERSLMERIESRPTPPPGFDGAGAETGSGFAPGVRHHGPGDGAGPAQADR